MEYGNTLSDHIVAFLLSARSSRAYYRILRERRLSRENPDSIRTALYRLEKQGRIQRTKDGEWEATGKNVLKRKGKICVPIIVSPFKNKSSEKLLLCFDIPEYKRYARKWLRKQLKEFGYRMIQKSVWVGPGPLPNEFGEIVKALNIKDSIKVFKLRQTPAGSNLHNR